MAAIYMRYLMSDKFHNQLMVKASSLDGQEQLKQFVELSKCDDNSFSFKGCHPPPSDPCLTTEENSKWISENWDVKYDVFDSKIITETDNLFIVEFMSTNGVGDKWLQKVSEIFPSLIFTDLYYLAPFEDALYVHNGQVFHHYFPEEIVTDPIYNNIKEYPLYSKVTPKDAQGNPYPFLFVIIGTDLVVARFYEEISEDYKSKLGPTKDYQILEKRLYEIRKELNICLPVNRCEDNDSDGLGYSVVLKCMTIEDAITQCVQLRDSIYKPIVELIKTEFRFTDLTLR